MTLVQAAQRAPAAPVRRAGRGMILAVSATSNPPMPNLAATVAMLTPALLRQRLAQHAAWQTALAVLLTRRAESLRAHAGQWALPGGRLDDGETPEQAALRELHEEIGLRLPPEAVLGRLDDYATRSGYVITPVLVWGGAAGELAPNPAEVASVHRIPTSELLRADAPILNQVPGAEHPVLRMPLGAHWVAAPTAAFLYQFREWVLLGRATRVAHIDQPRFAWR